MTHALSTLLGHCQTHKTLECDNNFLFERQSLSNKYEEKKNSIRSDTIAYGKYIYGCTHYSEAERLNEAITKRISKLSNKFE